MKSDSEAAAIRTRFIEEQLDVHNYTAFVMDKLRIDYSRVTEMVERLQELEGRLHQASLASGIERQSPIKTSFDMDFALTLIEKAIVSFREKIQHLCPGINEVDLFGTKVKHQKYVMKRYGDRLLDSNHQVILDECIRQWKKKKGNEDEASDVTVITEAVNRAFAFCYAEQVLSLEKLKKACTEMQVITKSTKPDSGTNILRQGFISLMTAFDAAIFDLVRVALRKKFFRLAKAFGKLSVEDMGNFIDFDQLREHFIETQLKQRYVKDLLQLLQSKWSVDCVPSSTGKKFEHLFELVIRRNIHVHNRGIVDERYLEDKKNLYALQKGQVAVIDLEYWTLANKLCRSTVDQVAVWADLPA